MAQRLSGRRYAQAIFELAVEQGQIEAISRDLEFADQVLQDEEFRAFLSHAEVPIGRKIAAIDSVLPEINPSVKNLISLLVTRGAGASIHDIRVGYGLLQDVHLGRQRIEVTSAVPLEPPELERITEYVSRLVETEVVVSTQVDQAILGGFIVQIGDRLLDGSTRTRLAQLRQQIRSETAVSSP
jgi:F-type H+-transporting ATPase subunit delta